MLGAKRPRSNDDEYDDEKSITSNSNSDCDDSTERREGKYMLKYPVESKVRK